jgi:hypothetical protein
MDSGNRIAMLDSQTGPIHAVAFAADGAVLTGGNDRTIRDCRPPAATAWCCLPARRNERNLDHPVRRAM